MRSGIDVAVGRADGDAKRVADLAGAEHLVVAHEARQDGEARGVGGRPAVGPPPVRIQIEERAGAGVPLAAVVEDVVELVEIAGDRDRR